MNSNTKFTTPTKEQVRKYMEERAKAHKAIPTQSDIRRKMGWFLKLV